MVTYKELKKLQQTFLHADEFKQKTSSVNYVFTGNPNYTESKFVTTCSNSDNVTFESGVTSQLKNDELELHDLQQTIQILKTALSCVKNDKRYREHIKDRIFTLIRDL